MTSAWRSGGIAASTRPLQLARCGPECGGELRRLFGEQARDGVGLGGFEPGEGLVVPSSNTLRARSSPMAFTARRRRYGKPPRGTATALELRCTKSRYVASTASAFTSCMVAATVRSLRSSSSVSSATMGVASFSSSESRKTTAFSGPVSMPTMPPLQQPSCLGETASKLGV